MWENNGKNMSAAHEKDQKRTTYLNNNKNKE